MSDPVTIVIRGEPVGKGRPRFGRGNAYTPAKTRSYERDVALLAKIEMGARPMMDGPVQITMRAVFAIPASWSERKKQRALLGEIRPTGRPDADNLLKTIADALNGIVYRDDSQITEAACSKRYGISPCVVATVTPIIGAVTDHSNTVSERHIDERHVS